jgi:hypothetical protein
MRHEADLKLRGRGCLSLRKLDPSRFDVLIHLGYARVDLGSGDLALYSVGESSKLGPGHAQVDAKLGYLLDETTQLALGRIVTFVVLLDSEKIHDILLLSLFLLVR